MQDWPRSLALAGAGKMGGALLRSWLVAGLPGDRVMVLEPNPSPEVESLALSHGIRLNPAPATRRRVEVLALAVKPQIFEAAAADLIGLLDADTLALSIMAGKTLADLAARLPGAGAFVRAMPNTPAAVGRGITGAVASPGLGARRRSIAAALLSAAGAFEWLDDEALIDVVTAISGSGPAYVFAFVEALAEAGAALGLAPDVAMKFARATVEGAGELMFREPGISAARLRENVTSPGGTTAAALAVLRAPGGLASLVSRAAAAAHRRAGELAG